MTDGRDHTGPGDTECVPAAGGREVMPKRAPVPLPWTQHPGTSPAREGEGEGEGRSQAAKTAAVAVGVVLLTLAGVLIGIPAFRTTLDPVPYPGSVPPTPPAAALRRSPAATAPASATASATVPPTVDAAPVTAPSAPVTTPSAPPSSRPSSQPVTTYPTTPGIVRPQAARNPRDRTARPRAIRPQPVRPRGSSVVMGTGGDSGTPAPTATTTSPDTTGTLTPAPQAPGRLKGQAARESS
ncbi:hypothetical protein [Nonomuraea wenchangensis]|uniref:hypothetical protein n=1 Tax=Nonomuraea wenchangensis TaxID=568860 RepID=UPI00331D9D8B